MELAAISNADLVRRCRANEHRAWREFARRFTKQVYGLSLRMLRNASEAEDATQETFLRVHRYLNRFDSCRPLEPWLASIGYNVCLRRLPGLALTGGRTDDESQESGLTGDEEGGNLMEDGASSREEAHLLHLSLSELAAQDRALLHMHYWQGMTVSEMADAVEMPANTVKIRLFRARTRLREVLGPQLGGGATWT